MSEHTMTYRHPYGITQIDADYIAPGIACVYLLREGDRLAIIETGTANTVPHIKKAIEQEGLELKNVDWIIPTHIHLDHAAGAGELMRQCPNASLVIHPRGAPHLIDPAKLEAGTMAVYGEEKYRKLYGNLIPIDASRVIEAPDNFTVDFNGRTLTFLDTPGHALHHFCIHDESSNAIFSGDTFGLSYKVFDHEGKSLNFVTTTPVHFDPDAMRASILRLANKNPSAIYLTHYGPTAASEPYVNQLLESLDAFVHAGESERGQPEGRIDRLTQWILDWLIQRLETLGLEADESFARQWLATDANLNAQGIDVWLKRQEKRDSE